MLDVGLGTVGISIPLGKKHMCPKEFMSWEEKFTIVKKKKIKE